MRVLILATGKTEEHNDSYGARLIEQGKAVPTPPGTARRENVTTPTVTALAGDRAAPPPPEGEARSPLPAAKKGRVGRSGKE